MKSKIKIARAFLDDDHSVNDLIEDEGTTRLFRESDVLFAGKILLETINSGAYECRHVYHRFIFIRGFQNPIEIYGGKKEDVAIEEFDTEGLE